MFRLQQNKESPEMRSYKSQFLSSLVPPCTLLSGCWRDRQHFQNLLLLKKERRWIWRAAMQAGCEGRPGVPHECGDNAIGGYLTCQEQTRSPRAQEISWKRHCAVICLTSCEAALPSARAGNALCAEPFPPLQVPNEAPITITRLSCPLLSFWQRSHIAHAGLKMSLSLKN